jgi:predicted alpha/beta-fold hydrolase
VERYAAPAWLPGGHLQTLVPALLHPPAPRWRRERWTTPDDDFIDLDWVGEAGPLIVLFHGLEGSSDSPYARALGALAIERGWRCVVPHFRGCSRDANGAMIVNAKPRAYFSGDSVEMEWVMRRLAQAHAPLHACGVSLGGNTLLKWLGDHAPTAFVRRAVAVCATLDVPISGHELDSGINRLLYTAHFLRTLKPKALFRIAAGAAGDAARVRRAASFREFDDAFTAPAHGFNGVMDYWTRASSAPWLPSIGVPALVLCARNDPFNPVGVPAAQTGLPSQVTVEIQDEGGHVGFPNAGNWLARRVFEYLSSP